MTRRGLFGMLAAVACGTYTAKSAAPLMVEITLDSKALLPQFIAPGEAILTRDEAIRLFNIPKHLLALPEDVR